MHVGSNMLHDTSHSRRAEQGTVCPGSDGLYQSLSTTVIVGTVRVKI